MAASDEWQERHLTPRGWIDGSYRVDGQGRVEVEPPTDRMMTVRYEEIWSLGMHSIKKGSDVMWKSEDQALINELLAKFGEAPKGL
jgi:hypothetical protein